MNLSSTALFQFTAKIIRATQAHTSTKFVAVCLTPASQINQKQKQQQQHQPSNLHFFKPVQKYVHICCS